MVLSMDLEGVSQLMAQLSSMRKDKLIIVDKRST